MHATTNGTHRCMGDSFVGNCEHVYYSENMDFASHCFGCIGLRHKKFCILNKQYTEEEYFALLPKIIEHMKKDGNGAAMNPNQQVSGSWGQFFPPHLSAFAYNETVAQDYYPLTKEQVLAKGWQWHEQVDDTPQVKKVIEASALPVSIADVPDDILNWAIKCEVTKRPYRIQQAELSFYRKMGIPIPRRHFDVRHATRHALRNPRRIWERECGKCGKGIKTTYSAERPEIIYCEECYQEAVF
jgi:hypothetical protein